jgi:hypothetical protein
MAVSIVNKVKLETDQCKEKISPSVGFLKQI